QLDCPMSLAACESDYQDELRARLVVKSAATPRVSNLTSLENALSHPKSRQRRLQPSAYAHRRDPQREPGRVVGLDRDAAQRSCALGRFEPARRNARCKTPQRLFLLHADDRIIIAGHAGVGHVAGATGQDLVVGGRHVGVRAPDEAGAAVAEKAAAL